MRWVYLLAIVLIPATVTAQPNMLGVVERVTAEDPARFACAHSGRSCEADWIKAVAWALHQIDPRWGLNAKRDGPESDLSLDVVTWRLGPTDRHVRAYDICGACGSASARAVWNDITNTATIGTPGTARWVRPAAVGGVSSGGSGPPIPAPPSPAPVAAFDAQPLLDAIASLRAQIEALTVKVDALAGVAVAARDAAMSAEHDAREINSRPVPVLSVPCLAGRVPRAFGGSVEVTFCPRPE